MTRKIFLTGLAFLLMGTSSPAQVLDFNFNDESAQLRYDHPISEDDYGQSLLSSRLLFNDDEETLLGSIGFDFLGEPGNIPGLELGVGGKVYGGKTDDDQDLAALGVSGQIHYAPPVLGGFGISARASYAPKIFAFLDAERLLEAAFRLSYAVTPKIKLHTEYQKITTDFEDHGNWIIDEGVRFGFEARF